MKDFFRPKYLLLAVVLPAALLWGTAMWEYRTYVLPKEKSRAEMKVRQEEALKEKVAAMSPEERKTFETKQARRELRLKLQKEKSGQPMEDHGFLKWTDISTSRWQSVYENLFGESLQFHRQHFLEDTLVGRPVFVKYDKMFNYIVEAIILFLALAGIWFGRQRRFLWLCLSCFGVDMFIHLILGFGLNEIFIMSPHFMFVLPIATAYLFKSVHWQWLRLAVVFLTVYLLVYNGYLLTNFLLTPIRTVL